MNLGNRHSQHSFAQIPQVNQARSVFNRSFATKDTFDFDFLTPMFVEEILPGDTINLNVKSFIRLATQVVPLMDNMYLDYFFFFVPNRLVWNNWEKFNGAQDDPGDSTDFLIPQLADNGVGGFEVGSIYDHFGLVTGVRFQTPKINALPFRAYNLIWNEWFRDQNLQDRVTVLKTDGPDPIANYSLLKRAKKHDYFTSALPWPQKGAAVQLPLGTTAPIVNTDLTAPYTSSLARVGSTGQFPILRNTAGDQVSLATLNASSNANWSAVASSTASTYFTPTTGLNVPLSNLEVDLSEATAATINQFRLAIMTQSLLELDARGGTRYIEIIQAHWGVTNPDFRLQRPEFLSGGTSYISQHVVAQTSESASTPQANLAAYSTAAEHGGKIGFTKSFTEHGFVIGMVQARADVTYQQGINKMWTRETRYDFFWPKLQELGEQAVLNQEIYAQGTSADEDVFGYQERYAEYRYRPSEIKGQFRSTYAETLDVWHLAEEFGSLPALNNTFIQSNTPIDRSLVVTEGYPALLGDFFFEMKHVRQIMTYGVPATLGRF